jgi:hypothetical protein
MKLLNDKIIQQIRFYLYILVKSKNELIKLTVFGIVRIYKLVHLSKNKEKI